MEKPPENAAARSEMACAIGPLGKGAQRPGVTVARATMNTVNFMVK